MMGGRGIHSVPQRPRNGNRMEEMATHSSILAWRTSWTEESGKLQSMASQRVEHN